jgi:alpha-L-fucosidase 2
MAGPPENSTWRLWYRKRTDPSKGIREIEKTGFLLGNGRSQVMVGGGIHVERIRLSEESSWSGGPGVDRVANAPPPGDGDSAGKTGEGEEGEKYRGGNVPVEEATERQEALEKVRLVVKEKRRVRPKEKIVESLKGDERGFGSQVAFGELLVEEVKKFETVHEYRRELDLETGVAVVTFSVGDLQYRRYVFCFFFFLLLLLLLFLFLDEKCQAINEGVLTTRVTFSSLFFGMMQPLT